MLWGGVFVCVFDTQILTKWILYIYMLLCMLERNKKKKKKKQIEGVN